MNIEVGKKYRTRSGDVVEIIKNDNTPFYPFIGVFPNKNWTSFTETGLYFTRRENPNDLIEELPAAEPLHPLWAQTMGQRDELSSVRVTCRMCDGAGCADSVTCENGTEVLPF